MKKIAFFMHNFNGGGAEKITIITANELKKRGYDVTLIMRECKGNLKDTIPQDIKIIDLKINERSKIVKNLKNIFSLKKCMQNEKFDIVFGVTFNMILILGLASKLMGDKPKMIALVHNTISKERYKFMKIRKIIMNFISNNIEKFVFVSEGCRKDCINIMRISEEKTLTIYNPVVSKKLISKSMEEVECKWLENNRKYKTILNIGRLEKAKNQKLLLETLKIVSKKMDVRLIILGEGTLENELKKIAKEKGIEDIVMFYGFTNNPYAFLSKADLFVLSSDYEGLPTVLIEALACGCNIVSTNCPYGPDEILEHGKYGALAKVGDSEDLAQKIIKKLKYEKNDRQFLMQRAKAFSINESINKYIKLIEGMKITSSNE